MSEKAKQLLLRLENGLKAYHDDVRAMSNEELVDHAFCDEPVRDDFAFQEVKKRLINSVSKDELRKWINEHDFVSFSTSWVNLYDLKKAFDL